ncbi:MAG: hypothetical protein ACPIOQ_68840, partial [Promethearchaeia archaeon]
MRATLQDVVAGVDGEAVLASMVQQLHLTEDLAASATCAGQNLDVSSMHKLGLADDIKLAAGKAVGGEHPFRTDAAAASASRRKIHANFDEVEMSKPGIGRTRTNDNEHLDIGRTVAILLSGLTVPMTSTHVLPGIVENIIGPFGTNNVHVFVHTSPWNLTGQNDFSHTCHAPSSECGGPPLWATTGGGKEEGASKTRELVGMYMDALNESTRAVVVDRDYQGSRSVNIINTHESFGLGGGYVGPRERVQSGFQGKDKWVSRIWEHHLQKNTIINAGHQYLRLRDLYPLVLAEERRMSRRYSHVIRMRTDSTWLSAWKCVEELHEQVPPRDLIIALPNPHHHNGTPFIPDIFWIASRAAAKATAVDFSDSLALPLDRK